MRRPLPRTAWALTVLLLAAAPGCRPPQPVVDAAVLDDLVRVQKGALPIILSAPHGGEAGIPGAPPRSPEGKPKGNAGFSVAFDRGTRELAFELAAELERATGRRPYFVVAGFSRRYLDCNRGPALAYDSAAGKAVYEAYHGALQRYAAEAAARFGGALVVDLHGQGTSAVTVYRGTKNGQSVEGMRRRFGNGIHEGPDSVLGRLRARGWTVHPEPGAPEQTGYTGGFITQTYGGAAAATDALQLEFGVAYRGTPEQRKATAQTLAAVLAEVAALYEGKAKPGVTPAR